MDSNDLDDILGITRCARCGHRLEGEIECPFCAALSANSPTERYPKWIYITACFLTSPISLYAIITTDRLSPAEKILSFSGCLLWLGAYRFLF